MRFNREYMLLIAIAFLCVFIPSIILWAKGDNSGAFGAIFSFFIIIFGLLNIIK
jgi:hypothetical protein